MHLKRSKLVFGTALATAFGFFAVPVHAAQISAGASNIVVAQEEHHELEDKAQGKINEMHDAGAGAANAVEQKHEEHEAAENAPHHHHGLKHKAKSKMNEVEGEASGAAGAVENAHHEHEHAEHE